ncbi:deoxycytidyl transferase [Puccinia graminis f. sp. tritici]|uniref:DNA repair protein REV1 n=1 Tax=Puccinia graminis f. sp. tritici TaxID=56615 RepID=A0A5B0RQG2_PUCGR|nr:deoxycytidyl transferase [Puccinia graminis f. sp. tritici]
MAVDIINQQTQDEDIIISDDEFDSLLATIPLPGFPPTDHQQQPPSQSQDQHSKKRKAGDIRPTINTSDGPINSPDQAYDPIKFGEISKYMTNKRKKLKLQESALRENEQGNSNRPQIFSGLVIHVNGYTNPPLSEIRSLIILHGGTYMAYLDHKSVLTHIIASSLTPKKREEFRAYKVVKPEWIVQCVSAGRLLNWSDFRLMGGNMSTQPRIAEGEATGGQAPAQRNLFDLAKDLHSARSTQTSPQLTRPKQIPSHHPSPLSRKSSTPKHTFPIVASGIQSTLKSMPTRSAIGNFKKELSSHSPTLTSSTISSRPAHSPAKNQSKNSQSRDQHSKEAIETPAQVDSGILEGITELPNLGAISCSDPSFIKTYFQQSRLHHLSTWKAELLQRVSILSEHNKPISKNSVISHKKLKGDASDRRVIMHVDFDCFFISAGLIARPELKGKPLAVCHAKATTSAKPNGSTSEIASCSYEARAFGVRNGQTLGRAKELCPEIQTIAYDFKLYEDLSFKFYNILLSYADELQAVSVDECLIDVSSRFINQYGPDGFNSIESSVLKLAEEIRTTVRSATQCEVSIGISYNVLLAKLATKKAKPCGAFFLDTGLAQAILKDLSIDDLPGFGWAQKNEIDNKLSVDNVGDLQTFPLSRLVEVLGPSRGKTLYQYAHGLDDRTLKSSNHERKSVSAVINYGIRFKKLDEGGNDDVRLFLRQLGQEVSRRLTELGVSGLQLTLKIMKRAPNAPVETKKYMGHGICEESSKATKLSGPGGVGVSDGIIIGNEAWKLLQSMNIPPEDLRGIGIQINRLEKLSKNIHSDKPQGQSTLMFQTTKPMEPSARRQDSRRQSIHGSNKIITNHGDRTPVASTSKKIFKTPEALNSTPFAIPPASQLDLEVVEALPTPLKSHILKSIASHQKPPDTSKSGNHQDTIDLVTPDGKMRENPNQFDLPSVSQVDWKMLAELPSSVRKPIEAIYAQRQSRRQLPPPTPPNFTRGLKGHRKEVNHRIPRSSQKKDRLASLHLAFQDQRVSRAKSTIKHRVAPLGPSQKLINKKTFKLITRNQPAKTPSKNEQGDAEEEATELLPTPNKISDEQLEALEIDVRFFRELKGNSTRAFQLDLIWNQFQIHSSRFKEVTRRTDRWKKWRKNFDRPAKVLQICLPEPPCLASRGGARGRKGLSKLEDVLELIEQWMLSSTDLPTHPVGISGKQPSTIGLVEIDQRDLEIIQKFLIDLIDPPPPKLPPLDGQQQSSLGQDFEKVFKIIQWWDHLILKLFSHNHPAFIYWKNILDNLKLKINSIACRDFGAPIY